MARWIAWALPAALLLARPAGAETFSDEALGYSINVPQGWRQIPIAGQERYIVARWQSDKEQVDGREGATLRPEMEVVLFDPKGKKTAEVREGESGTDIRIENPYRTYKDWIKSDTSGGRYISKEEEIEVNGVKTTWYEVAFEKLTVPRHGLSFVYHAEDIDYCVTTEVLEAQWEKSSPMLLRALKSFKVFPRKGSVKREVTGDGSGVTILDSDLSKLTPEERAQRRQQTFERDLKIATERLTEGWKVKRSKNYVALSHADDKFTGHILDQAEGVRAWCDANLAFMGTGIPGPEMLRICKDWDEERAFSDLSSRSGGGWVHEIVLSRTDGFWGLGNVAGRIFDRWLADKNPRLSYALPPWIERGIGDWIGSAYIKGGKLTFRPDGDLLLALKLASKMKKLIPPRELLQMSSAQVSDWDKALEAEGGGQGGGAGGMPNMLSWRMSAWQQVSGFVRFLLDGPGKGNARTKDLLARYVTELEAYVKEQEGKPVEEGGTYTAPKTEAEEEERFKNRETYWKDREKDLLKAVFERVFKDWTEDDWAALDKSYRSFAK